MREIKFRAWGKNSKEFLRDNDGEVGHTIDRLATLPDIGSWALTQHTGLKDKNSVEIYERDILRFTNKQPGKKWLKNNAGKNYKDMIVNWNKERAGWHVYWLNSNGELCNANLSKILDDNHEVVGNTYENPELVGGK